MAAYDKACAHMRADIARASVFFSDADQLVNWLIADLTDDVMAEDDRVGLALAARKMMEEIAEGRKAS
jgi:hypothetical protein